MDTKTYSKVGNIGFEYKLYVKDFCVKDTVHLLLLYYKWHSTITICCYSFKILM